MQSFAGTANNCENNIEVGTSTYESKMINHGMGKKHKIISIK
jgi:hypothetical protein